MTWIGCPGVVVAKDEQEKLATALESFDCVPLFLDPELQVTEPTAPTPPAPPAPRLTARADRGRTPPSPCPPRPAT